MENCLLNKKVRVEYIPKYDTIFNVPNSPAKDGMHERSKHKLPLPNKGGKRVKFLTDAEIEFLGKKLNTDLSMPLDFEVKCYWSTFTLPTLTTRSFELDLSDPIEYIQYKALSWWPMIAASQEEEKARPKEVRWRIIDTAEQHKYRTKSAKDKSAAWRTYGQFEKDKEVLLYLYYILKDKVYGYNDVTIDDLYGFYEPVIDNDAASFIFQSEQDSLKTRSLVFGAWTCGILTKKNDGFHYIKEDEAVKLYRDGDEGTIADAANFLNMPVNQKYKFEIEASFNKYKK